jgi:hypothetical protein
MTNFVGPDDHVTEWNSLMVLENWITSVDPFFVIWHQLVSVHSKSCLFEKYMAMK